jgi:hypothetical protein
MLWPSKTHPYKAVMRTLRVVGFMVFVVSRTACTTVIPLAAISALAAFGSTPPLG